MAQMKLFYTTSAKLNELPVEDGQIIFVPNDKLVCLDMKGQRFRYQALQIYTTNSERLSDDSMTIGMYYVKETNVLWYWDGKWTQITPSFLSPVFYGISVQEFPQSGIEGNLYFTDDGIYNWKNQLSRYNLIANANTWESI